MLEVWSAIERHGYAPHAAALALWVAASVAVGLTKSGSRGPVSAGAKRVLRELSAVTHEDEPGTFTVPRLLRRAVSALFGPAPGVARRRGAGSSDPPARVGE